MVAPALIPRKAGDKVKTGRRDAMMLVQTLRAGQLTAVWVADEAHEAMRDVVRLRAQALRDLRKARQQLLSFLLRHGLADHKRTITKSSGRENAAFGGPNPPVGVVPALARCASIALRAAPSRASGFDSIRWVNNCFLWFST